MKICRYDTNRIGLVEDEGVRDVSAVLDRLPALRWPLPAGDALIAALPELEAEIAALAVTAPVIDQRALTVMSPVANPGKIIGAPVNYRKHQAESAADSAINVGREVKSIAEYGLFLKAGSALVGPGEGIRLRFTDRRNDHEGELAVIIGPGGRDIPAARAFDHVAGYALGLDITVRGSEDRSLRKSVDTYAVVGPWLTTADEVDNPDNLRLRLWVNDALRQDANTSDMIYGVARLIEYASSFYTLNPGDILMTGTPEGVGPVRAGDRIRLAIEQIGAMTVAVR